MDIQPKQKFLQLVRHPVRSRLFLFFKLPSAFFSGVRVQFIDEEKCAVMVPYKWFSQNPFHSTYFACLAMAAELSTGLLSMLNTYGRSPSISMLVIKLEANYFKKATGKTIFICEEGKAIAATVETAINTNAAATICVKSIGKNVEGETVAEFFITWSFKQKQNPRRHYEIEVT